MVKGNRSKKELIAENEQLRNELHELREAISIKTPQADIGDFTGLDTEEDVISEGENTLIRAQEFAQIGNWKLDAITMEVTGSKELLKIFGIDAADLILDDFLDVVYPEDKEYNHRHIQNGIEQGLPWDIEHRLLLKDGSVKWVHAIGEPQLDKEGKTKNIIGIVQDITKQKVAEDSLRKSEYRYRTLIKNATSCVHELDLDGKFTSMNQCGLNMMNLDSEEGIIGVDYINGVIENEKPKIQKLLHKSLTEGTSTEFEFLASDSKTYYSSNFIPIKQDGKIQKIMGITNDITDRKAKVAALKASENHYRSLFESSPIPLWEEDFSKVKKFIDSLKKSGVKDFRKYFDERPEKVLECVEMINILDINAMVLELHEAGSRKELLDGLHVIFSDKSYEVFKDQLVCIATDQTEIEFEGVVKTLKGKEKHVLIRWVVVPGYENSMKRIYLSTIDITESKKIENALRKSEEKFRGIYEQSPLAIQVYDEKGKLVHVNRQTLNLFGIEDINSILGFDMWTDPNLSEKNRKDLKNGELVHVSGNIDFDTIKKNNVFPTTRSGLIFLEMYALPISRDNEITGYLVQIIDVTQRKYFENSLKESEENFSKLFNMTRDGYVISKGSGELINPNPAYYEMLGYSKDEILSVTWKEVTPKKWLDWELETHGEQLVNRGYTDLYEKEYIRKDGSVFPVQVQAFLLNQPKNLEDALIAAFVRDITERKISEEVLKTNEERLRLSTEIAGIAVWEYDIVKNQMERSVNHDQLYGLEHQDEWTIDTFTNATHPEDREVSNEIIQKSIKHGGPNQYDFDFRVVWPDESVHWLSVFGEVVGLDETGEATMIRGCLYDITERKKNEQDLLNSYNEIKLLKKQLELENISLKEEISLSFNYENMVYSSVEISDVLTQVEQVSNTNATVLILGETGTGKELIAKAIHNISSRNNKSLIRVNCAAIPSELLESELFGHKKGSFTGASKDRIGKFQLADGGTIFLDEIGEMPLELQPKLLRAIQEGEIEPIGSSEIIKLDLRIIAATNKELEKEVYANRFRQDLFFRLNVFPITIPPLRERIEDIPVLVDYFLRKFCKKYDKKIESIPKITLQQLKVYNWPGNVRELENLIERAVITSDRDILLIQGFNDSIHNKQVSNTKASLDEIQSNHIIRTLNLAQWKISGKGGAAELLDIKPSTLRDRMKKFGITRPKN